MHEGYIKIFFPKKGYGFIASPHQPDIFFHVSALNDDLEVDETLLQRRVQCEIIQTGRGAKAVEICAAD